MAKPDTGKGTVPTQFAETTPPVGADLSMWLINAINKMEGTLGRIEATVGVLQTQADRVESKVDGIDREVVSQAKWIHTLKAFAAVVVFILGWVAINAVWPWAREKLGLP